MPINPSPAAKRAGQLLWYLAEHPSEAHSISKLARALHIPRATCDSILQGLAQQGFVNRRETEMSYELGASCLALASAAQAANTTLNMASRQAEDLARELQACVVVSTVISGQIRAVCVFDRGPTTGVRAPVGHVIPLTPPFGVVFVAWDPEAGERWVQQGHVDADDKRWRDALTFAQRYGFSFSVLAPPGRLFGLVMDELAVAPDSEVNRHARDDLMEQLRLSEYLPTQIETDKEVQLIQVSAPVFDPDGMVVASIMIIGSTRHVPGEDVELLGRKAVDAADRATAIARGLRLGQPAVN